MFTRTVVKFVVRSTKLRLMSSFTANPLLSTWTNGFPPFSQITSAHFKPAYETAFPAHMKELKEIVENQESPSFENTIASFDRSGQLFSKIDDVFSNLCNSSCTPEIQAVEADMAAPIEAYRNSKYMYAGLFDRIEAVHAARYESGLTGEQILLVERVYLDFIRNGAKFDDSMKSQYAQITEQLAQLQIQFSQNVVTDESSYTLDLKREELTGCPDYVVSAARQAAIERNKPEDVYSITLSRSLVVPFLTYSDRKDLRERAWSAWTKRGELEPNRDNKPIINQILQLRSRQARMHGYNSFADYATADTMAGSPTAVMELLERVWTPAKVRADHERTTMEAEFGGVEIDPWDWRYYAEKVRCTKYDLDENELKPYLSLDCMCNAIFDCANRLFGLKFNPRDDVEVYHADVKAYEVVETVTGEDGATFDRTVGIFFHDNYARPHKKSGAWMSEFRSQSRNIDNAGTHRFPIVVNNNNFNKGSATEPTLLSFDDAVTLFHEFGHGLHGLLSNVTYNRLASTNVLRDWVELPSQLFEHWLSEPEVLKAHARHYQSGEPIPDDLLRRLKAARSFNQGFATVEYTASALVDQLLHKVSLEELSSFDVNEFERKELERLQMPKGIVMRHRPTHFSHLFSGPYYAAGYYVYLWAEVLDADGFDAFKEAGSCFDKDTARRVRQFVYSSGSSIEHRAAYRSFRGRDPSVDPMLKKKGLLSEGL